MQPEWSILIKRYRVQFGLTQHGMGQLLGVSQKTVSRWESGENLPNSAQQARFRDLLREPDTIVSASLRAAVTLCPAERLLCMQESVTLAAVSKPAIAKRPAIVDWIGHGIAPVACGVLGQMLDDRQLQRSIANGEIACVSVVATRNFRIAEQPVTGTYRNITSYFFLDGTLFRDTIAVPAADDQPLGYWPLALDEIAGG